MKKNLSANEKKELLIILKARFEKHMNRHKGLDWAGVEARLEASPDKLRSLEEMEASGGEPDVVAQDKKTGQITFMDCSPETPKERKSVCYDREAWESRKANRPKTSAMEMAKEMGIEMLDEAQYQELQKIGPFDQKTSSWLKTPENVRSLGGAIFGDYRIGRVFIYHNGAESYYGARAFRGVLKV